MMNRVLLFISVLGVSAACSNLDSVSPANRNTFVHYYGGTGNYTASDAIEVSDGYVLVGDSVGGNLGNRIVFIKTDLFGRQVTRKAIDGGSASAIEKLPDGSGYLIIGDSMYFDKNQSLVIDQIVRKMRMIKLSNDGQIVVDKTWGQPSYPADQTKEDSILQASTRTDVRGSAITFDNSGKIISTSTISRPKIAGSNQKTQVALHDPTNFSVVWSQIYDQDNKDYVNSRTVLYNSIPNSSSNIIVWATSAILSGTTTSYSFVRIPVFQDAGPYSTFVNGGSYGENDSKTYYSGNDIQSNGVSYGVIGTSRDYQGNSSNMFFVKLLADGTPSLGDSALFIDGQSLQKDLTPFLHSQRTTSVSQDEGSVLTASSDGGFLLAGYTSSTADGLWGNGGKDLFLIKLSPFNKVQWYKTFGGTGDEVPTSVMQTLDGGFLVSGTLTLGGQSSIFLLKMDGNGELKN